MFFRRHLGASLLAVRLLVTTTQAYTPVKFSMSSVSGQCGSGYSDAVALSDGNCHTVESFGKGFGGPGDIGVRSIDVFQISGNQPLIAYADHYCNDVLYTVAGAGCASFNGGAYSFALSDSTRSAATNSRRLRRDTDARVPFKNGRAYLIGGITYLIKSVVLNNEPATFFPIQNNPSAYEDTASNAWTGQHDGNSEVIVGGQETGFVIIENASFGQGSANAMGIIAGDAAEYAAGVTSIAYGVATGGNVIAEFSLTGDVN